MGTDDYGPWDPLAIDQAAALFAAAPFRWWVSGGHALDLHLGRSWRAHDDTDIGILRRDAPRLSSVLAGWDIHVAAAGVLRPWQGTALVTDGHENNLWCRRDATAPWSLDVTINEGDGDHWIYRRDPSTRVAWDEAVLRSTSGVPYLAPELQLLFKSKDVRPKDQLDAEVVIPLLATDRQSRLAAYLPDAHKWQAIIASG